jgi:disulfide bond formation protein DsbB
MEITCNRCHQPVLADNCFCPTCGLPQLVYTAESGEGQNAADRWTEAARDASMVDWKPAMRWALIVAVPAGLLSSGLSPLGFFGLFWMAAAAAWAVVLYVRNQRPAWITTGAGARIGLVTGLLAAWLAFTISGGTLFVERFALHQSAQIDSDWKSRVAMSQQMTQQWTSELEPSDAAEAQNLRAQVQAWMMSPTGHAGIETFSLAFNAIFLLFFAAGGGALGARLLARARKRQA